MEAKSIQKYVRITPRKMRVVAKLVRGKAVGDALTILQFTKRKAAAVIKKALDSAVANARQLGEVDVDSLFVHKIFVDEGPTLRRYKPRAMGRATRINKRTSHLTVEVAEQ